MASYIEYIEIFLFLKGVFNVEGLFIKGSQRLDGKISVHGSKNSSLPIIAASLLAQGECVIHNCPLLSDVKAACDILSYLGCRVSREGDTLIIDSSVVENCDIPVSLMREMRSSIVFLASILSRMRRAEICTPGGCEIGLRPIDLHISSLRSLGAEIEETGGNLSCRCEKGFRGCNITLAFPSVGATENIIIASSVSEGVTNIFNAAREPEIYDTIGFLNACGAKIRVKNDGTITVFGVRRLHPCEYSVIPDRITLSTYMSAVAAAGGDVLLENARAQDIKSVISVFEEMGCRLDIENNSIRIRQSGRLKSVRTIRTMPYPGFPTDAQAPVMAALSLAEGTSVIIENIFESRFKHVYGLNRMGADIKTEGRAAFVTGVKKLCGSRVCATDLRGGGALVCAALAAQGQSIVTGLHHIDRGYEKIEENLRLIGADIRRGYCNE